jgi:hypothetical protein
MSKAENLIWHKSAGSQILLPAEFHIKSPFPELHAGKKRGVAGIIVTITSDRNARERAELVFQQPPRSVLDLEVEILHARSIATPHQGKDLIWQVRNLVNQVSTYGWKRVFYLDGSLGIIADIMAQGEGLFHHAESLWNKVMDSFTWNPDEAVVLEFDGDEVVHRERYHKKRKRAKTSSASGSVSKLPSRVRHIQPVLDELLSLPPEDVNEDLDTSLLHTLLLQRVEGLSLQKAEKRLAGDQKALQAWMDDVPDARVACEFVLAFMHALKFELPDLDNR